MMFAVVGCLAMVVFSMVGRFSDIEGMAAESAGDGAPAPTLPDFTGALDFLSAAGIIAVAAAMGIYVFMLRRKAANASKM